MSKHLATVRWRRGDAAFVDNRYSRDHVWRFDGGAEVLASSSPQVVPQPMSNPAAVDPEEAFVAALSSCHMLWFLSLAAARGLCVDRYDDEAIGTMAKNAGGKMAMTQVTLRPRVAFAGEIQPTREVQAELHREAHEACFIAASVLTELRCQPIHEDGDPARA